MRSGPMRHRITLQSRVPSINGYGENAYTWETAVAGIAAEAEPLRGREFFAAAQAESEATVRFRIRYRAGIDATMRVLWRGQAYDIASEPIDVGGLSRAIELMCVAGIRDGRAGL